MRTRRDIIVGYAEWVAACRVLGFGSLVKGEAPSIERMIKTHNNKVDRKTPSVKGQLPYPPLAQLIAAKESDFRRVSVPDDLAERVKLWAPRKREEMAGG